jgi:hypothetical protein
MRRGRIITWTLTIFAAVLFVAPASAATPGEIAADLQDGRLDGSYTQGDLQAYLESAMAQGYGNPVSTPVTPAATPVTPAAAPVAPATGVAGVATPPAPAAPAAPAAETPAAPVAGVAGVQKTVETPLAETAQVGTLPFTGVDLALLVIGGSLLLLLGLGARRAGRAKA